MATESNFVIKFDGNDVNRQEMEDDGKKIYQSNKFFRSLANLMEHPEFKSVFKEHFKSCDDIKLFVMFLKLYQKIGDQFPDFNGYQKISLVKSLVETSSTRQLICQEVIQTFNQSTKQSTNQIASVSNELINT
jgi:hypothetical protein